MWCPGEDSNLHGLHHWYLKPARLPIPPPGHGATDKGWRFALSTIVVPRQVNRVGSTGAWFGAADTGLPPSYFPAQKWYVAARLDLRGGLHHVFAGPGTAHRVGLLPE